MAEYDAEPGAGPSHLGYAMLELALAGTAHDQQVSPTKEEGPAAPAGGRPQLERPWLSERHDGHNDVGTSPAHRVAMPRHAV